MTSTWPTARATGGPTPYYELRQLLYSGNTAPLGRTPRRTTRATQTPATDKLLDEYGAADEAKQKEIINKLQEVMLEEVPVVPDHGDGAWFQYSTKDFDRLADRGGPLRVARALQPPRPSRSCCT